MSLSVEDVLRFGHVLQVEQWRKQQRKPNQQVLIRLIFQCLSAQRHTQPLAAIEELFRLCVGKKMKNDAQKP